MIDRNKISLCLSVCSRQQDVGVWLWQLYDASMREVSTTGPGT